MILFLFIKGVPPQHKQHLSRSKPEYVRLFFSCCEITVICGLQWKLVRLEKQIFNLKCFSSTNKQTKTLSRPNFFTFQLLCSKIPNWFVIYMPNIIKLLVCSCIWTHAYTSSDVFVQHPKRVYGLLGPDSGTFLVLYRIISICSLKSHLFYVIHYRETGQRTM